MKKNKCMCRKCLTEDKQIITRVLPGPTLLTMPSDEYEAPYFMGMILCPKCGNKRCPHATDHEFECTDSNEPGQLEVSMDKLWRLWAKALGEKAGGTDKEADRIAIIRTCIVLCYIITNCFIVVGVIKHWN